MQATATPTLSLYTQPSTAGGSRIPSLDGLRAVSIALVLFGHLVGTAGFWFSEVSEPVRAMAKFGVHIFFVISGFLITSILIAESRKNGSIRIGKFYVRRAFRILPVAAVYLCTVALLGGLDVIPLKWGDLLHAATYTMNFIDGPSWAVGHLWSLSVEEQFYFVWPLTLVLLGWRNATVAAIAFAFAAPLLRVATKFHYGHAAWWAPTDADAIAIGCLLACLGHRLGQSPRYLRFLQSPLSLLPLVIPVAGIVVADRQAVSYGLMQISNICVAILIDRFVRYPNSLGGGTLNSAILTRIGVLSYSLYIWQELFLDRTSTLMITRFPFNLICAFTVAIISYQFVEQPFLAWRERLARPR